MKKLFISQPMRGKTDEEILRERNEAITTVNKIIKDDIEPIDSFFQNAPAEAKPLWFLGKSIELLSSADAVYFCKGWNNARGCRIEYECAKEYGMANTLVLNLLQSPLEYQFPYNTPLGAVKLK